MKPVVKLNEVLWQDLATVTYVSVALLTLLRITGLSGAILLKNLFMDFWSFSW
jgi:hypothetical protein